MRQVKEYIMNVKKLSVRVYNNFVKPEFKLSRKTFNELYASEALNTGNVEIPARLTRSGNPVIMR